MTISPIVLPLWMSRTYKIMELFVSIWTLQWRQKRKNRKTARREDLGLTRLLAQGSKGLEHKLVKRNTRCLDREKVNVENIRLSRVKIDYPWQIGPFLFIGGFHLYECIGWSLNYTTCQVRVGLTFWEHLILFDVAQSNDAFTL